MTQDKELKLVFAPGCFDNFDGTQEELDEMIEQIRKMAETGELFEKSNPVSIDELVDELTDDEIEDLVESMGIDPDDLAFLEGLNKPGNGRNLH